MKRYGRVTEAEIEKREKYLREPFGTSNPIDVFFKVIYVRVKCASEANTPLSQSQVPQMDYHTVSSYEVYTDSCRDWRRNPRADNMWDNFKIFFASEYNEL